MKILSRFLNGNFELLEPYEGKLSRTVLRGGSGSNAADLLDNLSVTANFLRTKTGVKKETPDRRVTEAGEEVILF